MLCSNYQNGCCLLPCMYFMDSTTIIVITIIIQLPQGAFAAFLEIFMEQTGTK